MIAHYARSHLKLTIVDYALSAVGGSLALYSVGQSLQRQALGWFCVAVFLSGLLFSFLIASTRRKLGRRTDSYLYVGLAATAMMVAPNINGLLPGHGFPPELGIVAVLAWMLMLGSFAAWTDSTLLFQAVPCISLFALVGVIEMFGGSTFAFFLFLIATAFLYARANHRSMLRLAAESGYQDLATIRTGPWRYVAGPEWAIASAFVVVLISLLGAPVIQQSVQGVAGSVRLLTPSFRTPPRSTIGSSISPSTFRIGEGPRELSDRVVMRAKLDQPRYLRVSTYYSYAMVGWTRPTFSNLPAAVVEGLNADRKFLLQSENVEDLHFGIILTALSSGLLPIPGEVTQLSPALEWRVGADGNVFTDGNLPLNVRINGVCKVPRRNTQPVQAPHPAPAYFDPYLDTAGLSMRTREFANKATRGAATDFEKAQRLLQAIAGAAKYNLNAKSMPPNSDAVDYFLFESHEGYCDLFATAMVMLARTQDIPARLATGYFPFSENSDSANYYDVKESDGHAWAELYFDGVGWVVFDATELADSVPGGERGASTATPPLLENTVFRWCAGSLLGLLALAGLWTLFGSLKEHLAFIRTETVASALAYRRFCETLQRVANRPRRLYETPGEYVSAVRASLGDFAVPAESLSQKFEAAFYGIPSSSGSAADLDRQVREFVKSLRGLRKAKA